MKAKYAICTALVAGKSYQEIHELLKTSHPETKAARSLKSCREQVAWYRSKLKRGLITQPFAESMDAEYKTTRPLNERLGAASAGGSNKLSYVGIAQDISLKSTFYEQLVEHVFISELLQEACFAFGQTVDVLRAEVDSSGYDVVFECNGILRYVQLKTSKHDAKRRAVPVNIALAQKAGACIIWLPRETDPATCRIKLSYLFFGGAPGETLPSLDSFPIAKHTKGDSTGKKNARPAIRLVPKSRFAKIATVRELVATLFDLR
jgi:hypothetical protein